MSMDELQFKKLYFVTKYHHSLIWQKKRILPALLNCQYM